MKPGIPRLGQKPEGWVETTFGNALKEVQRPAKLYDDHLYQLVIAKRSRGGIVARDRLYGRDISTPTQFYIVAGDFLISKRQIIHGACGIVPIELDGAVVSNEYCTLQPKVDLDVAFLNYFCHTNYFQQTCFHASVGVDVEKMIFRLSEWFKYLVYLPPLSEQRAIAAILSTWDEAITLTERLIAALRQRKQALMQMLLTGEVRFPGFEGKWRRMTLEETTKTMESGGTPSTQTKEFWDGNIPWITGADFEDQKVSQVRRYITAEAVEKSSTKVVSKSNILLVTRTGVGKMALAPFDIAISQDITGIAPKREIINPEYLISYLSWTIPQLARFNQGTSINGITRDDLKVHEVMVPFLDEQEKITDVLKINGSQIEKLKQILISLQIEKRGLMQQLLTGTIRVQVKE